MISVSFPSPLVFTGVELVKPVHVVPSTSSASTEISPAFPNGDLTAFSPWVDPTPATVTSPPVVTMPEQDPITNALVPAFPTQPFVFQNMLFDMTPIFPSIAPSAPLHIQDKHVQYYFKLVLPMQYLFAPKRVRAEMQSLILRTPSGVVTNAISSLAALHDALSHDSQTSRSAIESFLQKVIDQAQQAQDESGGFIPLEVAVAALHLVSYSLFNGGQFDWQAPLELASKWFEQTGVMQHPAVCSIPLSLGPTGENSPTLT